jgi:hydroxypyruvate isomerase
MINFSVCLDPLFPGVAHDEKVALIAEAGFQSIDFWGWRDKNIPKLAAACREYQVKVVNFNGHRQGSMVASQTHPVLIQDVKDTIPIARQLNCPYLMVITNQLNPDDSAQPYSEILDGQKRENVISALRQMLAVTPDNMTLMLEPLNTRKDHPGYWLTDFGIALEILQEINDPKLRLLCDLYHMGMMGNNLFDLIDTYLPYIGYFHAADFPGRHEPGTGSVDWPALLRHLHASGYDGTLSFEFFPQGDTKAALKKIAEIVVKI